MVRRRPDGSSGYLMKIIFPVFESCFSTPLTQSLSLRFCGSPTASAATIQGLAGQEPSKDLRASPACKGARPNHVGVVTGLSADYASLAHPPYGARRLLRWTSAIYRCPLHPSASGGIREHFYVLGVRGRKSGRDNLATRRPDRGRWAMVSGLRPRQFQLGAQCPYSRRSCTRPRPAAPSLRRTRASRQTAPAGSQSLSRSLRERGSALLPGSERIGRGSVQRPCAALPCFRTAALGRDQPLRGGGHALRRASISPSG